MCKASQAGEPATSATAATSQSFQGDNVAAEKSEGATDHPEPQHGDTGVAPVAAVVEACCASDDARNPDEMGVVAPVAPFPGEGGEPGLSPRDHAIDVTPAAEPAEQPADVIKPDDCDGELVAIVVSPDCDGE